jgi:hypothetical protein
MDPAQRPEFEAHLATCAGCQAEVAALRQRRAARRPSTTGRIVRVLLIATGAVLVLIAGIALGSWAWQVAHH